MAAGKNDSAVHEVRGTVNGLTSVRPPRRKREGTPGLSSELLVAIRDAINADEWLSNGEEYTDEKDAKTDARIYRRDVADFLRVPEKQIRSRVWQNQDEMGEDAQSWSFGIKLRGLATADGTDDDESGTDVEDESSGEDAA